MKLSNLWSNKLLFCHNICICLLIPSFHPICPIVGVLSLVFFLLNNSHYHMEKMFVHYILRCFWRQILLLFRQFVLSFIIYFAILNMLISYPYLLSHKIYLEVSKKILAIIYVHSIIDFDYILESIFSNLLSMGVHFSNLKITI